MSAKEGGLDLSDNNVSRVCGTQVEGLKCGKCRSPSLLVRSGSYNNAGNVWTLEEEKLPTFIQDAIEQVSGTSNNKKVDNALRNVPRGSIILSKTNIP